jgi:hypothetical protein
MTRCKLKDVKIGEFFKINPKNDAVYFIESVCENHKSHITVREFHAYSTTPAEVFVMSSNVFVLLTD